MQGRTCRIVEKISSVDRTRRDEQNALSWKRNGRSYRSKKTFFRCGLCIFAGMMGLGYGQNRKKSEVGLRFIAVTPPILITFHWKFCHSVEKWTLCSAIEKSVRSDMRKRRYEGFTRQSKKCDGIRAHCSTDFSLFFFTTDSLMFKVSHPTIPHLVCIDTVLQIICLFRVRI